MKKITINCPDDSGILSVVIVGGTITNAMWANQELHPIKDEMEINIKKPGEPEHE